ncbi:MAG: 50S ribosomal protein L13 [Proteobacteria bacterium]|nr:50S ribosomal protein L13 [Pseudomonadota bacterium]MBQ9242558.1 50S ribosomal protein L13 [Pseudomonadota bacterium]
MKTYSAKPGEVEQGWYIIDLEGQHLGRAAAAVASILRGKHRPQYTPHVDTGEFVIVVNVDKLVLTGKKLSDKKYYRHTGYVGGIKEITADKLMASKPEDVFKIAVKGMLPKNSLGRTMLSKLKIYRGTEHPHAAQQPKTISL